LKKGDGILVKGSGILKYCRLQISENGKDLNEVTERADYLYARKSLKWYHNEILGISHFISEQLENHIDNCESFENLRSVINTIIN